MRLAESAPPSETIVCCDLQFERPAQFDSRKAKSIEMRLFGGLSVANIAGVLQISSQSVMRDWKLATAWLHREIA